MGVQALIQWQWATYTDNHKSRKNLLLHIVVVPLFLVANINLIAALIDGRWMSGVGSLALMIISVALQGRGHKLEGVPPVPFSSPINAVSRILVEQWVTFPRYVFSGGWLRALRQSTS